MAVFKLNWKEFELWLDSGIKLCDNPEPMLNEIGDHMLKSVDKNFEQQGRPKKWKALKPASVKAKAKKYPAMANRILEASWDLRTSIYKEVSRESVNVGTDRQKAVYHDSDEPRTKMPKRKIFLFQEEDYQAIWNIVKRFLQAE